jgi:acyl-CoA thioesterase FadM
MEYEVREKKIKRLIATGYSVQVMYNYRKKRPFPIPPSLRKKIRALERM